MTSMQVSQYVLFFVGALGAFNGLLLSFYFMFFAKKRSLPSFFLGCLLAALSLRIGKSVFVYFIPNLPKLYLQIGLSACLFIGPALFFFTRAAIEQPSRLPAAWKRQLIGLTLGVVSTGVLYPYASYPTLWNGYFVKLIYAIWLLYILATGRQLIPIANRLNRRATPIKPPEKWLLAIYGTNVVIFALFLMALLFRNVYETYYGGAFVFSLALYGMIVVQLYQGKAADQFYLIVGTDSSKKIIAAHDGVALTSLDTVMTESALFRNPNLTIGELAKAVNLPSYQVSQLLNVNLGKNFTSYVNEYRIEEACRMIEEGHPFSLEAIGYEVGFNAKSTFYAAFKKVKATTPLLYKEQFLKYQSG